MSDSALRLLGRYLELDLEEVERVHAQHGDDASTKPRERMILYNGGGVSASKYAGTSQGRRTMAEVGKKLGWV